MLKKPPVLQFFSKGYPVEGQGDASKNSLDPLLMRHGEPVTLPVGKEEVL